ncbi:hypothetical protein JXB02_04785 [Candidatus Woesearchaeota archaeon]|nr:hypothetical protein [Candidatus Woesearchaeota archaeon]
MSLTDIAELEEGRRRPAREGHTTSFSGYVGRCDLGSGHCSNTDACHDCGFYRSMMENERHEGRSRPEQ